MLSPLRVFNLPLDLLLVMEGVVVQGGKDLHRSVLLTPVIEQVNAAECLRLIAALQVYLVRIIGACVPQYRVVDVRIHLMVLEVLPGLFREQIDDVPDRVVVDVVTTRQVPQSLLVVKSVK